MLNLKTLDDINNYYISKGIKPYWNVYEDRYLLKLYHIIEITKIFDNLIKLYPSVKLHGIGDFYTYEKHLYDTRYNNNSLMEEPTYEKDMIGVYYDYLVGGRYSEQYKVVTINHNSMVTTSDNVEKICKMIIHEFYHALDDEYKIHKNDRFKEMYIEYYKSNEFSDKQLKEFGAEEFTKSFFSNEENKVRDLIDYIINNNII